MRGGFCLVPGLPKGMYLSQETKGCLHYGLRITRQAFLGLLSVNPGHCLYYL